MLAGMIIVEKGPGNRTEFRPDRWEEERGYDQLYHETWDEILAAWRADRYASAFELSGPALGRYPNDWGMTFIRGSVLSSMYRRDLALPVLDRALRLRGGKHRAMVCEEIANAHVRCRSDQRAADWFREAFELGRHSCRVGYAECLVRECCFALAEEVLREGTGVADPDDRQSIWSTLGWLHRLRGEYEESGSCYREALRVGEFDQELQDGVTDTEQARAVVDDGTALGDDPGDRFNAMSYEERDRYPALTAELAIRMAAARPDKFGVLVMAAGRVEELGRHEAAWRLAMKAYELAPPDRVGRLYYLCGSIAEELRKFDEAERFHRRAVEADPDFTDHYVLLGGFLRRADRLEEAEEVFRRGTACPRGYVDEAWLLLGRICRAQRRYGEAAACFRKTLMIDPACEEAEEALQDVSLVLSRFPHLEFGG